jgi:hypothetical protein
MLQEVNKSSSTETFLFLENSECDFSMIRPLKHVRLFILMEYGQRVIIKFIVNDGLDAHQIAPKLAAQFGEDAYALRTVQFWIDEVRRAREDLHDAPRSGRPWEDDLAARIQSLLDENPFESACSMAETLHVSHATVLRYLHQELGFQGFHLRWVPHLLTPEIKAQRKQCVIEMLSELSTAERDGRHHLVTAASWCHDEQ